MARNRVANLVGTITGTSINIASIFLTSGLNVSDQANSAYTQANLAYGQANNAYSQANGSYSQANAAYTQANDAYGQANTATTAAGNAHNQANNAYSQANAGYIQANTARDVANGAYSQANNAYTQANSAYGQANSSYAQANLAYDQANNSFTQANNAYSQANLAYAQANNAFTAANNSNLISGGLISGTLNVTQDLIVSGNIYLEGNTTYINVATYSIEDSLIYLASNNQLTDSVDIGFMGGKNTSGTYSHTGLARDATDGKWKLFDGLAEEGHVGNVVDFANTYLATLVANVEANTLSVVNGVAGNVNFDSGTLFVDSVGNSVGVGTTSPFSSYALHVYKSANDLGPIYIENPNTGTAALSGFQLATSTAFTQYIGVFGTGKTTSGAIKANTLTVFTDSPAGMALVSQDVGPIVFATGISNTERMRVDANGNLGLGVTPSAWFSASRVYQFGSGGALEGRTNESQYFALTANQYIDSAGAFRYIGSTFASRYQQYDGIHSWSTAASGTAGNTITFTQAMTLTAGGLLGIGTSNPQELLSLYKNGNSLMVDIGTNTNANEILGGFDWINSYNTNNYNTARIDAYADGATNSATLRFWTASTSSTPTERARITAAGDFGIGTASPAARLDVVGASAGSTVATFTSNETGSTTSLAVFQRSGGAVAAAVKYNASNAPLTIDFGTTTNHGLTFLTNNTERMRIDSSGNVGIGTTSPAAKLHVAGTVIIDNANATNELTFAGTDFTNVFSATTNGFQLGTTGAGYLAFLTSNAERMRLDSSGNLGIGTTSPAARLEISASFANSAVEEIARISRTGGTTAYSTPRAAALTFFDSSGSTLTGAIAGVRENAAGNFLGGLSFYTASNLSFPRTTVADLTQQMVLTSSGNLGIGTTSPAAKLDVNGTLSVRDGNDIRIGTLQTQYPYKRMDSFEHDGTGYFWGFGVKSGSTSKVNAFFVGDSRKFHAVDGINIVSWVANEYNSNYPNYNTTISLNASGDSYFNGGNLGIGTTSPSSPLTVQSNASALSINLIGRSAGQEEAWFRFYKNNGSTINCGILGSNQGLTFGMGSGLTEIARFDTSGNLGIGTTSPANKLHVKGGNFNQAILDNAGEQYTSLQFYNNGVTKTDFYFDNTGTTFNIRTRAAAPLVFLITDIERARITAGGYFKASNDGTYQGSTGNYHEFRNTNNDATARILNTNASFADYVLYLQADRARSDNYYFLRCVSGTANELLIQGDGDVTNTNGTYAAFSDIKLKQDVVDASSQWDDIKNLRVRKYRLKSDPNGPLQIGVIAQELEEVSPGLVSEKVDHDIEGNDLGTTTKSVKYSILYMKSIKALQEAMARIEKLEAEVATLKAK